MIEQREEELLAKVDMLAAEEVYDNHKTCEKILHRCYVIIAIMSGVSILLGCFVYDYAQVRIMVKALREGQTKAHRIMWVAENVGEINLKTGRRVGPMGLKNRTIGLVRSEHWSWDWPFQHPINPGLTFKDFAEQSDHPFAKELKLHLENPKSHWKKGQGKFTNQNDDKNSNKGKGLS